RDRRGVREHLLDGGLAPELHPARVAAPADRDRLGPRDRDLARDQPDALPAVPPAARRLLRAAVRRPARRLALRGLPLHARAHLLRPGLATRDDRLVARRIRAVRMDRADAGPGLLVALARHAASAS